MITWQELAEYVGAGDSDQAALERAIALADVLVNDVFASAYKAVPAVVRDQCMLDVAKNLFMRSDAADDGSQMLADGTGAARISNDPFSKSWKVIRRYVMPL